MKLLIWSAAFCVIAGSSFAQSDSNKCKVLAGPANSSAEGSRSFLAALEELDNMGEMAELFKADEKKAVEDFMAARVDLLGPLKLFVEKNEDLAYALRKCARG